MKYILMMSVPKGGSYDIDTWPKKDFQAHMTYWNRLNKELSESRELVVVEGLTAPDQAKVVRAGKDGVRSLTACSRRPKSLSPGTGSLKSRVRNELLR